MEIWIVKESVKEQLETIAKKSGSPCVHPLATPLIELRVMPDSFFAEMRTKEGEAVDMIRIDSSLFKPFDPSSLHFSWEDIDVRQDSIGDEGEVSDILTEGDDM